MPTKEKKVIWKPGAPEGRLHQPHFISDGYLENREKIFKRVFKIPKKHGIDLSTELMQQFENLIDSFYHDLTKIKKPASSSELRVLFENLKNSAKAFIDSLEDIRHPNIKRTIPLPSDKITDTAIKELIEDVKQWEAAAKKKLIELPAPKQGPKEPPFLKDFVINLANIYEQATGEEATTGYYDRASNEIRGLFSTFTAAILDCLEKGIYQSGRSLIENILKPALATKAKTSQKKK